jgi:RNA polymerase sigma-70 factor (ECF subfamily)
LRTDLGGGAEPSLGLAEVVGPQAGLDAVDALPESLSGYHLLHATRADLLRRLGRDAEAADAYTAALALASNAAERAFLEQRLAALGEAGAGRGE